jgi:hypothetical protein
MYYFKTTEATTAVLETKNCEFVGNAKNLQKCFMID